MPTARRSREGVRAVLPLHVLKPPVVLRGLWLSDQKSGMKVACRQSHLLQRLPILRKVLWGLRRPACDSWRAASRSTASSLRFPLLELLLGFLPSELLGRPRLGHRRGGLRLHRLGLSSPTPQGRLELSTDRGSTPQKASAPLQCLKQHGWCFSSRPAGNRVCTSGSARLRTRRPDR